MIANRATKRRRRPVARETIRDTFTFPAADHDAIERVRARCLKMGISPPNKSEVVRAGLKCLEGLSDRELQKAVSSVERMKPGAAPRPAKK